VRQLIMHITVQITNRLRAAMNVTVQMHRAQT